MAFYVSPNISYSLSNPLSSIAQFIVHGGTAIYGLYIYIYIGMFRCEGYGFQAVYSSMGCISQSFGSRKGYHFARN